MSTSTTVLSRQVLFDGDRIAAAAALAATAREPYVVYEHPESMSFAEGEQSSITVSGRTTTLTSGGVRQTFAPGPTLFDGVRRAIGALPGGGRRVYGWAAFELTGDPGAGEVVHLMAPRREIRIYNGCALLLAASETGLDELHERLTLAGATTGPVTEDRVAIDLAGEEAALYRKAVAEAIEVIRDGALDKVILSRVVPVREEIDLPATYLAGRRGNRPARSFLLGLGGWEVAGFSPEIVARVTADRTVVTQPLAGTRALDGSAIHDAARREELYRDAKEVFEHAISVHLAATEMSRVCAPGTVGVRDFMSVKERGSVQHLASEVTGRLADGATAWDALSELFPAITASGIPKRPAYDLIRAVESGRGLYSGAVLTADADGTLDAALVLRSVFRHGGQTWLRAGAGVVAQSDPARELEETREKLLSVSRFLVPRR
ncbi:salicylate synthase [Actinoplanes sp. G11-F43]|uniref:salicylate synthase n=1 Tax=Actinoplanes sp. G11-F43 TaxID=3424130 RepID=UPI003D33F56D